MESCFRAQVDFLFHGERGCLPLLWRCLYAKKRATATVRWRREGGEVVGEGREGGEDGNQEY